MKTNFQRWVLAVLAIGLMGLFAVLTGCASGGYVEGEVGVYGVNYYEPYGYDVYGHWHPGYYVAPPRGGQERRDRDRDRPASGQGHPAPVQVQPPPVQGRPSKPAYRPAPPSQPAPSIPSKPRPHPH